MVKIKQKKQLNLPQLIEWAWENNVKNERYRRSDSNPPEYVWINENSNVELDEDMRISKTDLFTVEVESPKRNKSINEAGVNAYCTLEIHSYIDGEFKLIWMRENGLVE